PPRILFLGGSCTFGYALPWEQTYPAVVQEIYAGRGFPVDIVNGGVPLGDSSNRLAFLLERGPAIDPDLVVFSEAVNELVAVVARPRKGLQDLFRLLPEGARTRTAEGVGLLLAGGDPARAAEALATVARDYPAFVTPRYDLAAALLAAGDREGALAHEAL